MERGAWTGAREEGRKAEGSKGRAMWSRKPKGAVTGAKYPDMPLVEVKSGAKTKLKAFVDGKKPVVVCFVDPNFSPGEAVSAVGAMEEEAFKHGDAIRFLIVHVDLTGGRNAVEDAREFHAEHGVSKCAHLVGVPHKSLEVTRPPHHLVLDAKGKILLNSEDAGPTFMAAFE